MITEDPKTSIIQAASRGVRDLLWLNGGSGFFAKPGRERLIKGDEIMKSEVIEKMAALVTAAFGLVAALAWNGAIQAVFKKLFGTAEGIVPMLIYAVVVTIIAVIATIWIGKSAEKAKKEE